MYTHYAKMESDKISSKFEHGKLYQMNGGGIVMAHHMDNGTPWGLWVLEKVDCPHHRYAVVSSNYIVPNHGANELKEGDLTIDDFTPFNGGPHFGRVGEVTVYGTHIGGVNTDDTSLCWTGDHTNNVMVQFPLKFSQADIAKALRKVLEVVESGEPWMTIPNPPELDDLPF